MKITFVAPDFVGQFGEDVSPGKLRTSFKERGFKDMIETSLVGVKDCMEGLQKVINKEIDATFIEGMGCIVGGVGGPKRILNVEEGTKYVNEYSEGTIMETPFDNINVI